MLRSCRQPHSHPSSHLVLPPLCCQPGPPSSSPALGVLDITRFSAPFPSSCWRLHFLSRHWMRWKATLSSEEIYPSSVHLLKQHTIMPPPPPTLPPTASWSFSPRSTSKTKCVCHHLKHNFSKVKTPSSPFLTKGPSNVLSRKLGGVSFILPSWSSNSTCPVPNCPFCLIVHSHDLCWARASGQCSMSHPPLPKPTLCEQPRS